MPRLKLLRASALLAALLFHAPGCATTTPPQETKTEQGAATSAEEDPEATTQTRLVAGEFVSKSRGVEDGLLLLYPRIIPSAETTAQRGPALALQARLGKLLADAYPERPLDVRPEGERVCIKTGCLAASVGVLIIVQDTQCVAVVSVTAPGVAEHALMPWAGTVSVALSVPFREPLESYVKIGDMVPCSQLADVTLDREERIREALEDIR